MSRIGKMPIPVPAGVDVTIDGQTVREVGIRAKGNTSLTQVKNYGNDRYSFKTGI